MKRKYYLRGLGVGILVTSLLFTIYMVFTGPKMSDEQVITRAKQLGLVENTGQTLADAGTEKSESLEKDESGTEKEEKASDEADADEKVLDEKSDAKALDEKSSDAKDSDEKAADTKDSDTKASDEKSADTKDSDAKAAEASDTKASDTKAPDSNAAENTDSSSGKTGSRKKNGTTKTTTTTQEDGTTVTKTEKTGDDVDRGRDDVSSASGEEDEDSVTFQVRGGESSETVGANLYKAGLVDNPNDFNRYLMENGYDRRIQVGSHRIRKGSSYEVVARALTGG